MPIYILAFAPDAQSQVNRELSYVGAVLMLGVIRRRRLQFHVISFLFFHIIACRQRQAFFLSSVA